MVPFCTMGASKGWIREGSIAISCQPQSYEHENIVDQKKTKASA